MRLGILGDLHLTSRGPRRRLDNYFATQMDKLSQAFDIFDEKSCDSIIQVGDFFESPEISNFVISMVISFLRSREKQILCCYGQHDISGHNAFTLKRSPLKVLEAARVVKILSKDPLELHSGIYGETTDNDKRYVMIYGSSFGEGVPKIDPQDPYNILVTHRMVGDRPLYPGQDLTSPRMFLRKNPGFNFVAVGDYHYRFLDSYQSRVIVNPGCLMRKTICKFDLLHRPGVAVFDVDRSKLDIFELNIRPVKEVFDLSKEQKKDNEKLLKFIENLKESNESSVDWKRNLVRVLNERKSNENTRNLIDKALSKVKGEI